VWLVVDSCCPCTVEFCKGLSWEILKSIGVSQQSVQKQRSLFRPGTSPSTVPDTSDDQRSIVEILPLMSWIWKVSLATRSKQGSLNWLVKSAAFRLKV